MSRKDIYLQQRCEYCKSYFYKDELRRDEAGQPICRSCHVRQLFLKRRRPKLFDIPIPTPFGVSLLEVLCVVVILGVLAGITIPTMMYLKDKATETELKQLFYDNQGTDLGILAEQITLAYQQRRSLVEFAEFYGAEPAELDELEGKLADSLKLDSDELQSGAVIKAIIEWRQSQKSPDG